MLSLRSQEARCLAAAQDRREASNPRFQSPIVHSPIVHDASRPSRAYSSFEAMAKKICRKIRIKVKRRVRIKRRDRAKQPRGQDAAKRGGSERPKPGQGTQVPRPSTASRLRAGKHAGIVWWPDFIVPPPLVPVPQAANASPVHSSKAFQRPLPPPPPPPPVRKVPRKSTEHKRLLN